MRRKPAVPTAAAVPQKCPARRVPAAVAAGAAAAAAATGEARSASAPPARFLEKRVVAACATSARWCQAGAGRRSPAAGRRSRARGEAQKRPAPMPERHWDPCRHPSKSREKLALGDFNPKRRGGARFRCPGAALEAPVGAHVTTTIFRKKQPAQCPAPRRTKRRARATLQSLTLSLPALRGQPYFPSFEVRCVRFTSAPGS
jgi:hypothetical protein